jgi:hypothetical protein
MKPCACTSTSIPNRDLFLGCGQWYGRWVPAVWRKLLPQSSAALYIKPAGFSEILVPTY